MSFGGRSPGLEDDPFFSNRPKSLFEEDAFFSRRNFPSFPMMGFSQPSLEQGPYDSRNRSQHGYRRRDDNLALMDPFSMFRNMDRMMGDMMRAPAGPHGHGTGHYHSSSSVMHYSSSAGGGTPKVYTATSSVTQGPGGVKETRKSESSSETGMKKMMIGHHIGDRGHVIERRHNSKKNESEQHQEFINLDEDESGKFDKEWKDRTHRHQQQWSRGIQNPGGGAHGLSRPGLLPPLDEDTQGARKLDRRSRSPEREPHHRSSRKNKSGEGNAARRREYVKDDKKVRF